MAGHMPASLASLLIVNVNNGSFKGYQQFLGKAGAARNMATWYYRGNYRAILDYVDKEVEDFLKMYFVLKTVLPKIITT